MRVATVVHALSMDVPITLNPEGIFGQHQTPQRARDRAKREHGAAKRLAAGKHWEDSGLVFTSPIGTAMEPRWLAQSVDPRTIMETLAG
jgi:hypothetical protein